MTLASLRWFTSSTQDFPFKRHKVPRACQHCRRKKIRCDGKKPCGRCVQQNLECSYAEQRPTGARRSSDPVSKNATTSTTVSSPPCRQPLSPSPSPSPKQQQQQQKHHFIRERLDRISFSDDLYDSMSLQYNHESTIHRSQLFNNNKCLPPLMYDFFHFTSQPHSIWTAFIKRFKNYHRIIINQQQQSTLKSQQETTTATRDLLEEALTIFERHHLLYSSLFDIEKLRKNTLCPQFLSHMSNVPDTKDATTVYAILALVFRAAFQSLATLFPNDMATTLEHCAIAFANEAQHRFLRITFFETAISKDTETLFGLVAVAILLTHYLCTALCQENAYMILHLGIGYALRCSLGSSVKAFDSHGRKSKRRNSTKRMTEDRWRRMYLVLNAWQIWMSFYLHRDMTVADNEYDKSTTISSSSSLADIARDCSLSPEKDWALHAVVDYVDLLQRITNTDMDCMDIKDEMDQLSQRACISDFKETNLPACTLSLFHHVLSIQLFSCQQQDDPSKTGNERMILDVCGNSAAKIVDIIDGLTMEYHAPMTKASKQHDPINTAVLYPLCLATSTISTLYRLHHHHPPTNNRRGSSQKSPIPDANLPIFKLRRLLNPICSQVSAASVISSTLDEIQAAVRRSSTSCSRSSSSSSTGTLATLASSQQEERQHHPPSEEMTWQMNSTHLDQQQDDSDNVRTTTLAEDEDDILLPDDLFKSSTSRYIYPPRTRNEIDLQQLDKLFHNNDLRSNSAIATYHHHGNSATQGVDFCGMTTTTTPALSSQSISERGQKRRFTYSTGPVKRTRGGIDTLSCYGNETASQQQSTLSYESRERSATAMTNNPNTFPVPDQLAEESPVGFPLYADDESFLLMDIQANAMAAAAASVTNFNSERDNNTHHSTSTATATTRPVENVSSGAVPPPPPPPPPPSSSTSSSEPFITGILEDNDDSIPRQLPPPPKHQQQMPKNWSAISHQQQQGKRHEPFKDSVLETLHPNTLGSTSTTATMGMYPIVQSNHQQQQQQQLYSSTTHSTPAHQQQHQQHGETAETQGDDHMVPYFFNVADPLAQPTTTTNAWMTTTRPKLMTTSSQLSSSSSSQHSSWRNMASQQQNPSFAAAVRQHHERGILNHHGHATAAAQWLHMPPTAAAVAAAATDKILPVTANDMLATWPNG